MKAPLPNAKPYGWVIEFPADKKPEDRLVTFIGHREDHDKAYATNYAAKLHGLLRVVNLA